jgi:hypothetical protein
MVIVPQTPITEASFERWKSHRIDVSDENESYFYYIIPLIEVGEDEINDIESVPALFSSESDEFTDADGNPLFTMRLFDEDLPELTSEEEVEILYQILTKRDLLMSN